MTDVQREALRLLWQGFVHLSALGFWVIVAAFVRHYMATSRVMGREKKE